MQESAVTPTGATPFNFPFSLAFWAHPNSIRESMAAFREHFSTQGWDSSILSTPELVLAEICNNISYHAYGKERSGPIHLMVTSSEEGFYAEVTDQGGAMPDLNLPKGDLPRADVPVEDLPEGGFGWFLIRSHCAEITYDRHNNQNKLTFRITGAPE